MKVHGNFRNAQDVRNVGNVRNVLIYLIKPNHAKFEACSFKIDRAMSVYVMQPKIGGICHLGHIVKMNPHA